MKEYSVGVEVFNRSQDFDPRTDAVVRVSVTQLRRRLAAYYSSAGTGDGVTIKIPKGHYSAEFIFAEGNPRSTQSAEEESAAEPKEEVPVHTLYGPWLRRLWWSAAVLLLVLVGVLSGWMARHSGLTAGPHSVDIRKSLFWSTFLRDDPHATAVIGMATTAAIGPILVRVPNANDANDLMTNPDIQKVAKLFGRQPKLNNVYTGIGDALAASRLERAFAESTLDLAIVPAPDVRFRDLHAENVIFLSSLRFHDLRTSLKGKRDFDAEDIGDERMRIVNHAPRAGEQVYYTPSGDYVASSVDYALVSILPGTQSDHSILEVGGIGTLGTGGAAQYITEQGTLADLDRKLKADKPKLPMGVQILLRVDVVEHQVVSVHYLTHHWLS